MNGIIVVIKDSTGKELFRSNMFNWPFNPVAGDTVGPNFAASGIHGTVKHRNWPNLETLEITLA